MYQSEDSLTSATALIKLLVLPSILKASLADSSKRLWRSTVAE